MMKKLKKAYILIQTFTFGFLAAAAFFTKVGHRYDAFSKKVDYRKLYGVVFIASLLETLETCAVMRFLSGSRRKKA